MEKIRKKTPEIILVKPNQAAVEQEREKKKYISHINCRNLRKFVQFLRPFCEMLYYFFCF